MEVEILAADAATGPDLDAFLQAAWGSDAVVAHGERIVPSRLQGLVAVSAYRMVDDACEITSIVADPPRTGIGSRLMDEVIAEARRAGCRSVWLMTTNDNLDALRFYQRRGFRMVALRPGAVDVARRELKPEIPEIGAHAIPIRDELDLELEL